LRNQKFKHDEIIINQLIIQKELLHELNEKTQNIS